jgi:large subunit ribosomal protein L32e
MKEALAIRKRIKKSKPNFVVKESKFSARVKSRWRFPRGKHSKVRQQHKGRIKLPGPGFSSPRAVRGLHATGLEMITVNTLKDLENIDTEKQGIYVGANVGGRKKVLLLQKAQELKLTVFNAKDIAAKLKAISDDLEIRKKKKDARLDVKSKKQAEKKKKAQDAEKKKKEETKGSVEEKIEKEEQKKEKEQKIAEKTITKKQ